MLIIFVHGWSVTNTNTYGKLPAYLRSQGVQTADVWLGKYVSFEDTVTVNDLSRAFHEALRKQLGDLIKRAGKVACVTHSTGGPVVRQWVFDYYRNNLKACPISHLIMLAPANHGSALAQLGKGRLSRIKAAVEGIEPGQRVLDFLELGSPESWSLNEQWLSMQCVKAGVYPFVLTGHSIERSLYDALNSYTDEKGSDGVVRIASANMNYALLKLEQGAGNRLVQVDSLKRSPPTVFAVLPGLAHSGKKMGIMRSVTLENAKTHPTVEWIKRCLAVNSVDEYRKLILAAEEQTMQTLAAEKKDERKIALFHRVFDRPQCTMMIFRLRDDAGQYLTDYELRLTAGPKYSDQALPPGFFVDRQRNSRNAGKLTYYLNYDVLDNPEAEKQTGDLYGFGVKAFPEGGLAHYMEARFQSNKQVIGKILRANETLMIEITMKRLVDKAVFQFTHKLEPERISDMPTSDYVE